MSLAALRTLAPWLLWVPLVCSNSHAAGPDGRTANVDKLFATWDRNDSPGCAVAVIHDGKIVYTRGYGMADLEQGVAISSTSLFNIASISKQFTCFVIMLLAQAGLLAPDDDVRQHLPELPDFGKKITLRHLMNHTSGLREDWVLLHLAGWRSEDVTRESDVMNLVLRQKELNFAPGQEYLYCNTGYDLLAAVVRRTSKQSLRQYAQEKILQPLGMKSSVFADDYRQLIPKRARAYQPRKGGGFEAIHFMHERTGASNLYTSVEDLAKWDRNFYEPKVGGKEVIAQMLQKGKLNSGKEISYAAGLRHGEYRGQKYIEHQGSTAGFRSAFIRFSDQRFSVIVLANVAPFNPGTLVRRVTDIYLSDKLGPPPAIPKSVQVPTGVLDSYAGHYRLPSGEILSFTREGERLIATGYLGRTAVRPLSDVEFWEEEFDTRFVFVKENGVRKVLQRSGSSEIAAERIVVAAPTREQLAAAAGEYRSGELNTIFTLQMLGEQLLLRHRKGTAPLQAMGHDEFKVETEIPMVLRLTRAGGSVSGFTLGGTRFRNLRFSKVEVREVP